MRLQLCMSDEFPVFVSVWCGFACLTDEALKAVGLVVYDIIAASVRWLQFTRVQALPGPSRVVKPCVRVMPRIWS